MKKAKTGKKHLLFILPDLKGGGAERVTLQVLRNLDPSCFEVTLFLIKREGAYCEDVPAHVRVVCALGKDARIRYWFPWIVVRGLQEARGANVVIGALELVSTYVAFLIGALQRKPVIGWVHSSLNESLQWTPVHHRWLARYVYPRLRYVVFVSDGARVSLANWLGMPPLPTWGVIHNPLDIRGYRRHPFDNESRISSLPFVVAMGRLDEHKGFDLLIRAHALARKSIPHRLLILGEGRNRIDLEALVKQLALKDTVLMPGFVRNPLDYMRKAMLFVLSSRFEGLSMVLMEAMAMQVPVLATDCPSGPREILKHGRYGMLIPPEDVTALAEGIVTMLKDPGLRAQYVSLANERVKDFYPASIMPQWERLLAEVGS